MAQPFFYLQSLLGGVNGVSTTKQSGQIFTAEEETTVKCAPLLQSQWSRTKLMQNSFVNLLPSTFLLRILSFEQDNTNNNANNIISS